MTHSHAEAALPCGMNVSILLDIWVVEPSINEGCLGFELHVEECASTRDLVRNLMGDGWAEESGCEAEGGGCNEQQ